MSLPAVRELLLSVVVFVITVMVIVSDVDVFVNDFLFVADVTVLHDIVAVDYHIGFIFTLCCYFSRSFTTAI